MKIAFIEAKRKFGALSFDFSALKQFKKIGLLSTVQFLPIAKQAEKALSSVGIKVFTAKTLANETQVLGCRISAADAVSKNVDAFLLLSSGKWHALMVSKIGKPVFVFNGYTMEKLSDSDIQKFNMKRKSALMKFLSADKIGILVSSKPGQLRLNDALDLKKKLEKKGKKAFILVADTLNVSELENFDIKSWVSTACPGLFLDNPSIINIDDIRF